MLTLDLKDGFEELACLDHVQRMVNLLTELDTGQGFSSQGEFPGDIQQMVLQLGKSGIHSAYLQACVLFSVLAGRVALESLPACGDEQQRVVQCIGLALQQGLSRGAFQHIHRVLAGAGVYNQPWFDAQAELDCLNALPASQPAFVQQGLIDLACVHEGPITPALESLLHDQATFFRTSSGFQHRVSDSFTPSRLLAQVCQNKLSSDLRILSLSPVVERCELGFEQGNCFVSVQKIQLVDNRQVHLHFAKRPFDLSASAWQQLESRWQQSDSLAESSVQCGTPLLEADLSFQAGWGKSALAFSYAIQGSVRLRMPARQIAWQASVLHEGVLAQLLIQVPHEVCIDWSLEEQQPVGQIPLGSPLLLRQQNLLLHAQLHSAVCVGKPVLSLGTVLAGQMQVQLSATVNPEDRRLQLGLELSHSDIACEWLAVDALQGWSSGVWRLLPAALVMRWDLFHG